MKDGFSTEKVDKMLLQNMTREDKLWTDAGESVYQLSLFTLDLQNILTWNVNHRCAGDAETMHEAVREMLSSLLKFRKASKRLAKKLGKEIA